MFMLGFLKSSIQKNNLSTAEKSCTTPQNQDQCAEAYGRAGASLKDATYASEVTCSTKNKILRQQCLKGVLKETWNPILTTPIERANEELIPFCAKTTTELGALCPRFAGEKLGEKLVSVAAKEQPGSYASIRKAAENFGSICTKSVNKYDCLQGMVDSLRWGGLAEEKILETCKVLELDCTENK